MGLMDAAFDDASKRLASSIRSGTLHPILHKPVLKLAQRWRLDLTEGEKAIETTVNLLLRFTTVGTLGVVLYYEDKLLEHWYKQREYNILASRKVKPEQESPIRHLQATLSLEEVNPFTN